MWEVLPIVAVALFGVVVNVSTGYRYARPYASRPDRRIKRTLRRVRPSAMAAVRDGAVAKIVGHLSWVGPPLTAPFTGRKCAYYRAVVEQGNGGAGA